MTHGDPQRSVDQPLGQTLQTAMVGYQAVTSPAPRPHLLSQPENAAMGGTSAARRKDAAAAAWPVSGRPRASAASQASSESWSKSSEPGGAAWRTTGAPPPTISAKPAKKALRRDGVGYKPTYNPGVLLCSTHSDVPTLAFEHSPRDPCLGFSGGGAGASLLGDGCGSGSLVLPAQLWHSWEIQLLPWLIMVG